MHSTLYYKDVFDHNCTRLMPKIEKLARMREQLKTNGREKAAARVQADIDHYTIKMGEGPRFVDRFTDGTQLITLFDLTWEDIADNFTDQKGRMTPAQITHLLAHLVAQEELFATRARAVTRWWIIPNPFKERRLRQKFDALKLYLHTAIKQKGAIGITP